MQLLSWNITLTEHIHEILKGHVTSSENAALLLKFTEGIIKSILELQAELHEDEVKSFTCFHLNVLFDIGVDYCHEIMWTRFIILEDCKEGSDIN